MATRPERVITYEDYVTFPDEPRLEVIGGEAHVVPSPSRKHQELVVELVTRLHTYLKDHGGGKVFVAPFDVVLTDTDIVQPDIVFIAGEDLDVLTDANVKGVPSWLIEVLSPSDPARDRKLKLNAYERTGVPEYWIVDPDDRTVTVYRLDEGSYGPPQVLSEGVVRPLAPAGFTLDLGDLFADRDWPEP